MSKKWIQCIVCGIPLYNLIRFGKDFCEEIDQNSKLPIFPALPILPPPTLILNFLLLTKVGAYWRILMRVCAFLLLLVCTTTAWFVRMDYSFVRWCQSMSDCQIYASINSKLNIPQATPGDSHKRFSSGPRDFDHMICPRVCLFTWETESYTRFSKHSTPLSNTPAEPRPADFSLSNR